MTSLAASALVLLLGSANALRISETLKDVANSESMRIPALRSKEAERTNMFQSKIAGMVSQRRMQDSEYTDEYAWDESMDQTTIGFDITSYAIKYTQCATVQTYSDSLAENEDVDSVLAAQRFALFRLCPKDQCSSYSTNGCGSNYGDYIVSLDKFLLAMLEYQEHRVAGYCEYCQNCATIEAAKSFWKSLYSTRDTIMDTVEASYQTWYTNYLESYANGDNTDAYANVDSNTAAQMYYKSTRESSNYANQYAANNYYSGSSSSSSSSSSSTSSVSSSASQYQWTNQNNWEFQNSANRVYSNQDAWGSIATRGGAWFGRTIQNGYYANGAFVQQYGYFNSAGTYVSLEDDTIEWDETLYGEMPEGWDVIDQNTESCSYKYAGSCYNQFDACMQILQDQDYQVTQSSSNGSYQNQQQAQESYTQRATLKDFIGCVEVDPMAQYSNYNAQQSQYSSQQSYTYNQPTNYNCYDGDEACQKMQAYANQMWTYQQEKNANRKYFVGPHCGSNGRDISLSVYQDEFCLVVDSKSTVEGILGYSPYSSSINLFPDDCLSCFPDEAQEAWYEDEEVYTIEPACSMLYQYAGKCNKHLTATEYNYAGYSANSNYQYQNQQQDAQAAYAAYANNEWKQMYQSENQAQNENAVCSFIESMTSSTYNENGEISIAGTNWASPSSWNKSLSAESRAMNGGMKAVLVITALAAAAMALVACVLHNVLARKNIPWKPRRSKGQDPTDIARQNSGITMGRSRSGPGNNPLL